MADIAIRVEGLEKWRDGNGHPGAAAMIADHEKRLTYEEGRNFCQDTKLSDIDKAEAVARVMEKQLIIEAVSEAMRTRAHSGAGRIRAWGPYFAAFCALLATLASALLGG